MICLYRTDADDVELETTLQELALNLGRDAVETDMGVWVHSCLLWGDGVCGSHCESCCRNVQQGEIDLGGGRGKEMNDRGDVKRERFD